VETGSSTTPFASRDPARRNAE